MTNLEFAFGGETDNQSTSRLPITTEQGATENMRIPKARRPITPGQVLREDFIERLGMTQGAFAQALGVDRSTIAELLRKAKPRAISTDMALRLGHALGTSPQYWLNLQLAVSLYDAEHSPIKAEVELLPVLVPS